MADRFVELACLTYGDDESRERRAEATALLAAQPDLVHASVHAAAAAGDVDALREHVDEANVTPALLTLCYSRIAQRDAVACLELLLSSGADPNAYKMIGECRFTALTGVIGEGEAGPFEQPPHPNARAMAEQLLDAGADPNDAQAIYNMHFLPSNAWLELLLSRGLSADLDFLLGQACVQGFVERVRLLLAHGVSVDGRNRYNGRTHLENAMLEGHTDIVELLGGARPAELIDNELRANALLAAARHGRFADAERALGLGVPIDGRDAQGLTALHHAAREGHLDVVRLLVTRGAALDVRDPVYDGTPLGHARHTAEHWPRPHGDEIIALLSAAASTAG